MGHTLAYKQARGWLVAGLIGLVWFCCVVNAQTSHPTTVTSAPTVSPEVKSSQTQPVVEPRSWEATFVLVGLPIGVAVVLLVGGGKFIKARKQVIAVWLFEDADRRQKVQLIQFWPPLVASSICVNGADFPSIFAGKISVPQTIALVLLALIVPIWFHLQRLEWWYSRSKDTTLANLQVSYETSESLRKHAELQRNFYLILGRMFLKVVGLKADRVRNTTTNMNVSSPNAQLKRIREGLDPDRQSLKLIVTLYDIYAQRLGNVENDLRVAYFQLGEDGYLTPIHAWNGVSEDCITLPAGGLRENFKVDQAAQAGSLVASVAKTGLMIIVPDAEKADADVNHPFKYLTEQQRATIKSIACIPLRRADEDVPIRHVISLDSDKTDFFAANADTESEMKEISRHLAFRLLFEGDMQELFERVLGGPDAEIQ